MNEKYVKIAKKNSVLEWLVLTVASVIHVINKEQDESLFKVVKYYNGNPNSIALIRELLWTKYIAGCVYQQYYQYDFRHKTKKERKEYIGSYEFHDFLMSAGTAESHKKFEDKYATYLLFRNYYKRDVIKITGVQDFTTFDSFVAVHKEFVVKPIDDHGGKGFRIIDTSKDNAKQVFFEIVSNDGAVCEELIMQSHEMARFHPQSINTVRFVSFYDGKKVIPMYAFVRIGVGNSRVDNTSAGGMAAAIDLDTGKIVTKASNRLDVEGTWFDRHPDTDAQIIGAQIPRWNELLDMVQQLAVVIPEQKYVGWDLALTDDGWVMVEGNAKPLIATIQILTQKGIREKYKDLLD